MAQLSNESYLVHLKDIKNKLTDFLELVNLGKLEYLKEIALKHRILYMNKSGTEGLFKKIQKIHRFEFRVWVSATLVEAIDNGELSESLRPVMMFHNGVYSWLDKGKQQINIIEAFEKNAQIIINEHSFSFKKIIETVADKMGGAHIDEKVSDKDLILHSNNFLIGNLNIASRVIYDTTCVTIDIINIIINYIEKDEKSEFIIEFE